MSQPVQIEIGATDAPVSSNVSRWHASLSLSFESTQRGTILRHSRHVGPLYVQKPFYPEGRDLAHIYILHPPGGLVSGDDLTIDLQLKPTSHVLVTTPGAGRIYKARADRTLQKQTVHLHVGRNSSLEWMPMETILYPNANTHLTTHIELEENAHFIGWEVTCLGLPASGQAFDNGRFQQSIQILQQGRLLLRERLVVDDNSQAMLDGRSGLQGQPVNGVMLAGPFLDTEAGCLSQIQNLCNEVSGTAIAAVTQVGSMLIIRYLGNSSEQARALFAQCWASIRPDLLGRQSCPPRIWST